MERSFDVIIVGGSYAGLSAALALGRSLRKVLVIDSGKPCNRFTPHSQNFLTQDGKVPADISALAKADVLKYDTVSFFDGLATSALKTDSGFEIGTESGEKFAAGKVIFATGIRDIFPEIEGFADCWGKSVIHCPYCHGYEFRGRKTLALADGEAAVHYAKLVGNLTDDLTIMTNGKAGFSEEQLSELQKRNIGFIEKEVSEIIHKDGSMSLVMFTDGSSVEADAMYARLPFEQHCRLPEELGCELSDVKLVKIDGMFHTNIHGIYAVGDCASPMRSVANAVAMGNFCGAVVNLGLTELG